MSSAVAEALRSHPGVAFSTDYKYMCSDPGQNLLKKAIEEHNLTGVVVAACSPRMHEKTFRQRRRSAGLNPYLCEMANIREHCSWVHEDREEATAKAIDIVAHASSRRSSTTSRSRSITVPVTKRALVIGGGIAGIQAALDIADGGHQVVLVETGALHRRPHGPALRDLPDPRLLPVHHDAARWSEATPPQHHAPHLREIEKVDGYIGNFQVTIRKKARSVNEDKCTGCGDLHGEVPGQEDPQRVRRPGWACARPSTSPSRRPCPTPRCIDRENCTLFKGRRKGRQGAAASARKSAVQGAIDYEQRGHLHRGGHRRHRRGHRLRALHHRPRTAEGPSRATANTATASSPT